MTHLTISDLDAGLDHVRSSPKDEGVVELIVCRPGDVGERKVLDEALFDSTDGVAGDTWKVRRSRRTGAPPDPDKQVTLMNARVAALLAGTTDHGGLAGDQLYVDLDLGYANIPPGTRLQVGEAVIEVSAAPHTGCPKFRNRFGADAMRFVNSPVGRELNLRGINAKIVVTGVVRPGDAIRKI